MPGPTRSPSTSPTPWVGRSCATAASPTTSGTKSPPSTSRTSWACRVRQWFETENPYAFQDMSEVMLESSRKGYWNGEPGLVRQVAEQYARSVLRHGEGGGLRGGGNVEAGTIRRRHAPRRPSRPELDRLAAQYQERHPRGGRCLGGADRRHRARTGPRCAGHGSRRA